MKKLILFMFTALLMSVTLQSCHNAEPQFNFNLAVTGYVDDTHNTGIYADWQGNVANETIQNIANEQVYQLSDPRAVNTVEWLDEFVAERYLKDIPNGAEYVVTLKGYVKEKITGLSFEINKTFTNRQSLAATCVNPYGPPIRAVEAPTKNIDTIFAEHVNF